MSTPAMPGFAAFQQAEFNCLPCDGQVHYHGAIVSQQQADSWLDSLLQEIDWQADQAVMFGKHITTRRKIAWHADQPFAYRYSRTTRYAQPWTDLLLQIKHQVEQHSGARYNACLLNLYHDGADGVGWHSDAERELQAQAAIGSLSLGAQRRFAFKHKNSKQIVQLELEHGSLLIMRGTTQQHWLHRLPPARGIMHPRVNLTFRRMRTPG